MKKSLITFSCVALWAFAANAQTVINMPVSQNPLFEVSTNQVDIATIDGALSLGADIVIKGGSGNYSYRWYNGDATNNTLSTESTLTVYSKGVYILDIDDTCDCRQTVVFNVGGAGIDDVQADALSIYPNPTKGHIFIKGVDVAQISVVSLGGALVDVITSNDSAPIVEADLSALPKGTYILTLSANDGGAIASRKIIRN